MRAWMKRHKILTGIIALFLLLRSAYYITEVMWFRSLIPDAIETEWWPVAIDGDDGLLAGCGSASFTLKKETLQQIKEKGLAFFEQAKEAQEWHPFGGRPDARHYKEWKETPMPDSAFSEGWYSSFGCDSSFGESKKRAISNAARTSGGYYTDNHGGGYLLILPSLEIVMFIYYD